jgi:hypothetical protein
MPITKSGERRWLGSMGREWIRSATPNGWPTCFEQQSTTTSATLISGKGELWSTQRRRSNACSSPFPHSDHSVNCWIETTSRRSSSRAIRSRTWKPGAYCGVSRLPAPNRRTDRSSND